MLRPSQTVHGLIRHPFGAERPWRILFIRSLQDTNPASIFEGRTSGKREALSLKGGGVEGLVLARGVKQREIRFFDLERLGYRVTALRDCMNRRPIVGKTFAERETIFQQMMLDYPPDMGYEFVLEGSRNGEPFSVNATFVREETLVETLEREAHAETGHTVEAMPWNDSQPWVDRREKHNFKKNNRLENIAYTIPARITSAYTGEIEEADESAGRVWLNLLDSLPLQLARLLKKRPKYSKLPFFSHIQKTVEILRNKRIKDSITVAIREEMAKDHPLKAASYAKEFPMVDWEWNERRHRWDINDLKKETSLIHPSWLLVLEYKAGEWEWLLSLMRDTDPPISYLTSQECKDALKNFRQGLGKDEIETMEQEAPKTVVAVPEVVASAFLSESVPKTVTTEVKSAPQEESSAEIVAETPNTEAGVVTQETSAEVQPKLVSDAERIRWLIEGASEEDVQRMTEYRRALAKEAVG